MWPFSTSAQAATNTEPDEGVVRSTPGWPWLCNACPFRTTDPAEAHRHVTERQRLYETGQAAQQHFVLERKGGNPVGERGRCVYVTATGEVPPRPRLGMAAAGLPWLRGGRSALHGSRRPLAARPRWGRAVHAVPGTPHRPPAEASGLYKRAHKQVRRPSFGRKDMTHPRPSRLVEVCRPPRASVIGWPRQRAMQAVNQESESPRHGHAAQQHGATRCSEAIRGRRSHE